MNPEKQLRMRWTKLESHGDVPVPRHGYKAQVYNDLIIVYGGGDGQVIYNDIHVLNTVDCKWTHIPLRALPELASFGFALIGLKMYVFGGMDRSRQFLSDLFLLNVSTCEVNALQPKWPLNGPPPCARIGHSFTAVSNHLILLFGGVTTPFSEENRVYLNDLYGLVLHDDGECEWQLFETNGPSPPARDSHSACLYKPDRGNANAKLIIYGGMCGHRLRDLWALDISTMTWCEYRPAGIPPAPRSMHSSVIFGRRMFIFGGWSPMSYRTYETFMSHNKVSCLDLKANRWLEVREEGNLWDGNFPRARTGHSMVLVRDKIYMWSGRTGAHYFDPVSVQNDLWYLEVAPEKVPQWLRLVNKSDIMMNLSWMPVPHITHYILQIQIMPLLSNFRTVADSTDSNCATTGTEEVPTTVDNCTNTDHNETICCSNITETSSNNDATALNSEVTVLSTSTNNVTTVLNYVTVDSNVITSTNNMVTALDYVTVASNNVITSTNNVVKALDDVTVASNNVITSTNNMSSTLDDVTAASNNVVTSANTVTTALNCVTDHSNMATSLNSLTTALDNVIVVSNDAVAPSNTVTTALDCVTVASNSTITSSSHLAIDYDSVTSNSATTSSNHVAIDYVTVASNDATTSSNHVAIDYVTVASNTATSASNNLPQLQQRSSRSALVSFLGEQQQSWNRTSRLLSNGIRSTRLLSNSSRLPRLLATSIQSPRLLSASFRPARLPTTSSQLTRQQSSSSSNGTVTLMRTREGMPVAVVPRRLIPSQPISSCTVVNSRSSRVQLRVPNSSPPNIIIISRRQSDVRRQATRSCPSTS